MDKMMQEAVDAFEAFAMAIRLMIKSPNIRVTAGEESVKLETWYPMLTAQGNEIVFGPYTPAWVTPSKHFLIFHISMDYVNGTHYVKTADEIMACFNQYLEQLVDYILYKVS